MIVADGTEAPKPGELKGTGFFGDTPAEAEELGRAWSRTEGALTVQELAVSNVYEITAVRGVGRVGVRERAVPQPQKPHERQEET
jgi:hypothetical protein